MLQVSHLLSEKLAPNLPANKPILKNPSNRNLWVDYLRSTLTVLVVAHHAALAYATFSVFDKVAYIRSTHAVVDAQRWFAMDIFAGFNDVFFMSLMFLISGLFLPKSLEKKGTSAFLRDRVYRLLLPFLLGGTLLMLLAYFPSFYLATSQTDVVAYVKDFFTTQQWPVGPPWFLWVLFVFNALFVGIFPLFRHMQGGVQRFFHFSQEKPWLAWSLFLLLTAILYVPLTYVFGPYAWTGWGPFDFQLNRAALYGGYFLLGAFIGSTDFNNDLFATYAGLVRQWKVWLVLALAAFVTLMWGIYSGAFSGGAGTILHYAFYLAACTLICLAFLTIFSKFAVHPIGWWTSLSENAYLIYLTHYVFVTWMQFLLLGVNIPVFFKFIWVFFVAFALSWLTAILLRKFGLFRRYL